MSLPRFFGFGLLLLPLGGLRAQQVLLQADVAQDTLPARTGPNRRWFAHAYLTGALAAGPAPGLAWRPGPPSGEYGLGLRLKRRLGAHLALNADLRYALLRYGLADAPAPGPGPGAGATDRSLVSHQVLSEVSLRLNPGRRRGNYVGTYLDLLAGGGYSLGSSLRYTEPAAGGRGPLSVSESRPPYLTRWQGYTGLRLGFNQLALTARYRLSPLLTDRPGPTRPGGEPPRWLLGLELGWF